MVQPSTLLPLLLALLTPAAHAAAEEPATQTDARGYVETSYVIAPRQVEEFVLEGAHYDEHRKYSGAGFRYAAAGHQETRIDVYVYPAGRIDRAAALTRGMEAFRADLQRAVEAGMFTDLEMQDDEPFALTGEAAALSGDTRATGKDKDMAEILAILAAGNRPSGRKLAMTMNLQPHDWPMHSAGHLFYRQLYFFKVRATAAQERIATDAFHALVDRAARVLVPAIEVANVGACAKSVINVSADASADDVAKALVTQASEHEGYNCHESADAAGIARKSTDAEVVEIAYQPEEWTSQ